MRCMVNREPFSVYVEAASDVFCAHWIVTEPAFVELKIVPVIRRKALVNPPAAAAVPSV